MSTPCNSLNVQLIKVSSLASYSSIKNTDLLMIVENTGGSKYSRQSTLSDLKSYVNQGGFSSYPAASFYTFTDASTLSSYTSGGKITFNHTFTTVPTLVRVVLKCVSTDGLFSTNQELDISSCYNNNNKPICSVLSTVSNSYVLIPTFSTITAYSNFSIPAATNLTLSNWSFKINVWK